MKFAICQLNPTVGAFEANVQMMVDAARDAVAQQPDIITFPELIVCGYPPLDLLDRSDFIEATERATKDLVKQLPATPCIFGTVTRNKAKIGRLLRNSAIVTEAGRIVATCHKMLLPTYDVFDECRYFEPATEVSPVNIGGHRIGITICEDLWNDAAFWEHHLYPSDPAKLLAEQGATLLVNIAASPFHFGKRNLRHALLANAAERHGLPVIHCNAVGANDDVIFEGGSTSFDARGALLAEAPRFKDAIILADTEATRPMGSITASMELPEEAYQALVLGVRDYFRKTGFSKAVLGLSGGIDSALTAAIGCEALGPDNVLGVLMPGPYSSEHSISDAYAVAENLGMNAVTAPIGDIYEQYTGLFRDLHPDASFGVTEENVQSRIRGNIVMAIANREGRLVLTTGNKSELAVGYCTLYGDMNGAISVIGDLTKTVVYDVCRWLNRDREVIPESTLTKPPSAELAPDQKDSDSLPPYSELDAIITAYVEEHRSRQWLIDRGHPVETVDRIIRLININEYKRKQAAVVLKVTEKAFGYGRRVPIARELG